MTVAEYLEELRGVMQLVRDRIVSRRAGVPGEESIEDLTNVLGMLTELEAKVASGTHPPQAQRYPPPVADYALDAWGYGSQIAQEICEICSNYRYSLE